jgi:acyl carrier protein
MTPEAARAVVLDALRQVAPEADPAILDPRIELREQLDVDSMDFLNFIIGLHEATGVDIPEVDYPELETLDRCVEYLMRHAK